ncbi:hypothetical protein [Granulosicoccus antarcticus]|uniref:hypothetical protein n=1 Tax=Granulosicoccus antarcticus TaxID=437505 RepID=UPI0012FE64BE|nr:hypothetical protein [Granulosicoccus antarcticus]
MTDHELAVPIGQDWIYKIVATLHIDYAKPTSVTSLRPSYRLPNQALYLSKTHY